ncbi:MAG: ParB N-terminal domain-containing protein [Planctomycetes bacterium]|nr:ParB N-terminal domain-containing protein [Planctomycetota bacterium]
MSVEYVEPATLTPAPYNPRNISEQALLRLAALLDAHGFVDPVIARREDRMVLGGHQRLKANAIRRKPDARVPCVFLDGLSDERAKALNIALNNTSAQGEYDPQKLAELLQELDAADFDLMQFTGFDQAEISGLIGQPDGDLAGLEEVQIPESFEVVVECESEGHQQQLFERFRGEGLRCRLLIL